MKLSAEQKEAVTSQASKRVVIAGPGSGKTRVLVEAILHQIKKKTPATEIAVITYTNAAAAEIAERLKAAGAPPVGYCGTLHAFLLRLLRQNHALFGLPETLAVFADSQRETALQTIMDEMGVTVPMKRVMEWADKVPRCVVGHPPKEVLVALEYHRRLRAEGLLDFAAILQYGTDVVVRLSRAGTFPFKSLFWDEYQDAANADNEVMLNAGAARKMIVGDPDQAIYGFRGGNVAHLNALAENATTDTDEWEVHYLQDNYRSTRQICEAAQFLIEQDPRRVKKFTRSTREGAEVQCLIATTPAEEMHTVSERITFLMDKFVHEPEDFAVICRTNRMAAQFTEHLGAVGIPVAKRVQQDDPPDWRAAKLLVSVLANPWSDFAVIQYLKLHDGDQKAKEIASEAARNMVSVSSQCEGRFLKPIDRALRDEGFSPASISRIASASRLLDLSGEPDLMNELLIVLQRQDGQPERTQGVTVCTAHAAKGREWKHVFVVGLEQGNWPKITAKTVHSEITEERRLCYVAMTRAAETLTITCATSRPQWRGENMPPGPMMDLDPSDFFQAVQNMPGKP